MLTFLCAIISTGLLVSAVIVHMSIDTSGLDKSGLLVGLTSFNTGAIIATFLTLFHSNNQRIAYFRGSKVASATMYLTIVLNTALVSIAPMFAKTESMIFGIGIDNIVCTIAIMLTLQIVAYLFVLIHLYFK